MWSLALALLVQGVAGQDPILETPKDLVEQYMTIFKTANRNAASHLWTSFVVERGASMPRERFYRLFRGFCSVSGSPIPDDPHTMYKTTLNRVNNNGSVTGVVRFCCWPCVCDMNEHVRVDSRTVQLADGPRSFDWLVIGDPCKNSAQLQQDFTDPFSGQTAKLNQAAPELECLPDGKLRGATYSDAGHVIIGMFFTDEESLQAWTPPQHLSPAEAKQSEAKDPTFGFAEFCKMRQSQGYNSGMGLIFHRVAQITPIGAPVPLGGLPAPEAGSGFAKEVVQQVELAPKVALPHCPSSPRAAAPETGTLRRRSFEGTILLSSPLSSPLAAAAVALTAASAVLVGLRRRRASAQTEALAE